MDPLDADFAVCGGLSIKNFGELLGGIPVSNQHSLSNLEPFAIAMASAYAMQPIVLLFICFDLTLQLSKFGLQVFIDLFAIPPLLRAFELGF